jgi:hypothetical protein
LAATGRAEETVDIEYEFEEDTFSYHKGLFFREFLIKTGILFYKYIDLCCFVLKISIVDRFIGRVGRRCQALL